MRTAIRTFFLIILVVITPVILIIISIRQSGISSASIKTQLAQNNVYSQAITAMEKQIDASIQEGKEDDPLVLLGPFIKKEITPQYLQRKTETFLDDLNAWVQGKSSVPPKLSFSDLKEKLVSEHKDVVTGLIEMSKTLKEQQAEMKKQARDTGENIGEFGTMQIPDVERIMQSDFSIPLGTHLAFIKNGYELIEKGLPVLAVILIALVAGILLLSPTMSSKFRWLAAVCIVTALGNIPSLTLAWGLRSAQMPSYLSLPVRILFLPVLHFYIQLAVWVTAVLLIAGAVSFIISQQTGVKKT